MMLVAVLIVAVSELPLITGVSAVPVISVIILATRRAGIRMMVLMVPVEMVLSAAWITLHNVSIALKLDSDLLVNKLEERVLVHLIVEVVGLVCPFLKPWSRHLQLGFEIVTRVQDLLRLRQLFLIRHLLLQ